MNELFSDNLASTVHGSRSPSTTTSPQCEIFLASTRDTITQSPSIMFLHRHTLLFYHLSREIGSGARHRENSQLILSFKVLLLMSNCLIWNTCQSQHQQSQRTHRKKCAKCHKSYKTLITHRLVVEVNFLLARLWRCLTLDQGLWIAPKARTFHAVDRWHL